MSSDKELINKYVDPDIHFVSETIPKTLGWNLGSGEETVLDIGCGNGCSTVQSFVPIFPNLKSLIGMDINPNMIEKARSNNSHPKVEYILADFEKGNIIEEWRGKFTKVISIACFQKLKDQRSAFQKVYHLLKPEGEGAFFFGLQSSYYDIILDMVKNPKWGEFLKDVDCTVPESHLQRHDSEYYEQMAEDIGFKVLHCQEHHAECDLRYGVKFSDLIPATQKRDFWNDLVESAFNRSGRKVSRLPVIKGKKLGLVLKKTN